jgi:nucleoside-triphosphatase THEP1
MSWIKCFNGNYINLDKCFYFAYKKVFYDEDMIGFKIFTIEEGGESIFIGCLKTEEETQIFMSYAIFNHVKINEITLLSLEELLHMHLVKIKEISDPEEFTSKEDREIEYNIQLEAIRRIITHSIKYVEK